MSPWLIGEIVLVSLLGVSIWIAGRGEPVERLVGLEFAGILETLALLTFAQEVHQPSYLIVPTMAVVLSFAGTLVFTRLLAPRSKVER